MANYKSKSKRRKRRATGFKTKSWRTNQGKLAKTEVRKGKGKNTVVKHTIPYTFKGKRGTKVVTTVFKKGR